RYDGATYADAEIGKAHRFTSRTIKPLRQQNLIGQGTATNITEGVDQVERVKHRERVHRAKTDQRHTGHHDPGEHQAPGAKAIDDPAGEKTEKRTDNELAQRISRRYLRSGPPELTNHVVVVERKPV